ncbi:MAG: putative glycoside hydrolase [Pseudomonadota bacterium]
MARAGEPQLAAKFKLALVSFYAGMGKTRIQTYVDQIKAINPSIKLGTYVVLTEYRDNALPTHTDYELVTALDQNGWWVRDAVTGNKVQWTAGYGTWATNPTAWAKPDASGRRWPEFKAQFDTTHILGGIRGLDYIYVDQVNDQPWVVGDYMHNGTNQPKNDPTLGTEYRKGQVAYFNALRSLNPGKMILPNAGSLATPEFINQVEGAFMECVIGKSWSIETWGGWNAAMNRYRAEMAQTKAPHDVVLQACGATADPALARYGLASALMHDGYFAYTVNGQAAPPWFDEYDAKLGTAVEPPPTAPTASGIWMRRYTNGVALVNPSKTTAASIDVGAGYKRLTGTQDPVVNNGQAERMVTLQPRTGLILIKQ